MDVRGSFPLTVAHLRGKAPDAPTVAGFVEAVCTEHATGDIPSRAVRDLARFEAMLLDLPAGKGNDGPPPTDAPCVLAPHVRVLVYGAGLPEMVRALREGQEAKPRPARGWYVVWRDAQGTVVERLLPREEGWILERLRKPAVPDEALEDDEERAIFEALWRAGVVVRADAAGASGSGRGQ